jgi:hypothetical protein
MYIKWCCINNYKYAIVLFYRDNSLEDCQFHLLPNVSQYQYVSSYNRYSNMTSFKRFGSKSVVKYAYIGISGDRKRKEKGHALGQAQICGGVKPVNRISIPPLII